jgi:hypothetical protein
LVEGIKTVNFSLLFSVSWSIENINFCCFLLCRNVMKNLILQTISKNISNLIRNSSHKFWQSLSHLIVFLLIILMKCAISRLSNHSFYWLIHSLSIGQNQWFLCVDLERKFQS